MARIVMEAEKYQHQWRKKFGDNELKSIIRSSIPEMNNFQVMDVKNNKFLHAAFLVRKAELLKNYSANDCQTEILIHATSKNNVSSILKNNLNWRYVTRAKYGFGVSFSHDSKYANKYCNNKNGTERAFIICEVLLGKVARISDNKDYYPRHGAHTYKTHNALVIVKFDDFTFYPIFVIFYSTKPSNMSSSLMPPILEQQFIIDQPQVPQNLPDLKSTHIPRTNNVLKPRSSGNASYSHVESRSSFSQPQPTSSKFIIDQPKVPQNLPDLKSTYILRTNNVLKPKLSRNVSYSHVEPRLSLSQPQPTSSNFLSISGQSTSSKFLISQRRTPSDERNIGCCNIL